MWNKLSFIVWVLCVTVSPAFSQWEDNGDGSSILVLDPSNENVDVVDEGPDYIRYGVTYTNETTGEEEYMEFDIEKATWNRFDINTTGAVNSDEEQWGWPDGRVNVADVRLYYCLFQSQSDYADLTTSGAVVGDAGYGKLDGVVDNDDLNFFNAWLADFFGSSEAIGLMADALSGGDPCTNRATDEPQLAPHGPGVKTGGESEVLEGAFPDLVGNWRYVLARDALKPQSSLDLLVKHWADIHEICEGEPGAQHTSEAYHELNFLASLGAVAGPITKVYEDRDYDIEEGCGGSNIPVGNSTLVTMYRMKFKVGIYLPVNRWWAGLGVERNVLTKQRSGAGCGCP